ELDIQTESQFKVPSLELKEVELFRVGPLTGPEVQHALKQSNLLANYQEQFSKSIQEENSVTPTPLHKGHLILLLTSGQLNGYISKGVNQHLVKGTSIKLKRTIRDENEEGEVTQKEKEYYSISVKILNSMGEFKTLL